MDVQVKRICLNCEEADGVVVHAVDGDGLGDHLAAWHTRALGDALI